MKDNQVILFQHPGIQSIKKAMIERNHLFASDIMEYDKLGQEHGFLYS